MTTLIRDGRASAGVSQAALAARLGITPSAAAQLERNERAGTIKLERLAAALRALGLDLEVKAAPRPRRGFAPYAPANAGTEIRAALAEHDQAGALRILLRAARGAASSESDLTPADLDLPPAPSGDDRWDLLTALAYRHFLGARAPQWVFAFDGRRLVDAWYPADPTPTSRRRADRTAPPTFRRANVLIAERALGPE